MTGKEPEFPPKESFYSTALDEVEKMELVLALDYDGIDEEIALIRMQIKAIVHDDPKNLRGIVAAASALERLVKTRYDISKEARKSLKENMFEVLRNVGVPMGIGVTIGSKLK